MEERTIISALGNMVESLGTLSLVAIAPDDPLALPEPPGAEQTATYEAQAGVVRAQVDASYHDLLAMSTRDLLEFLRKLPEEPDYARDFSEESQRALARYVADLREL